MFRRTKLSASLLCAFGGALASVGVSAQEAQQLGRVEITGSAIRRVDAETAVPVTVIKFDELKRQGITSVEQVLAVISASQSSTGTSQAVGSGTGGASFVDLRGIGANKTLVLLNGRRIANNALDSSAPDVNTIPFAMLERIEVLRDGASALYGTDAIGGVINFITRKTYEGGTITVGADKPETRGGESYNFNAGIGFGDLEKSGFNIFGFVDYQIQNNIGGTQRPFNSRQPGGLSPTTFPANYFQAGNTGNPTAPSCNAPNLIPNATNTGCQIKTASFVDYTPNVERISGMLKGSLKLGNDHVAGIEYFATRTEVRTQIAPVPYGGLWQNPRLPDGVTPNPFYPGNASGPTPNIPLSPTFSNPTTVAGAAARGYTLQPGYINVRFRNLAGGSRANIDENEQQRFVGSLEGSVAGWEYRGALTFNENKYVNKLDGYSDGATITGGVLNGVINPFGPQTAAGAALISSANLAGVLQTAKGTVYGADAQASRELGDWLGAGRPAAVAFGADFRREEFENRANFDFATRVIASTGFDPETLSLGERNVSAFYTELNVPLTKKLEVTGALRYDNYSDFGNTTNPKVSFQFRPEQQLLFRGSYSTGFRAPSLYELNAAQTYTSTGTFNDPVNCPGGVPVAGRPASQNCQVQFQILQGGNKTLDPEKAKNATLGFIIEPTTDVSFGVDLWWIKIRNVIGAVPASTILGDPVLFAAYYARNPNGDLSTDGSSCPSPITCGYLDGRNANLGNTNTRGLDFTGSYRLNAGALGNFNFGLQTTYVMDYKYQDFKNGPYNDSLGVYIGAGPIFRWQHSGAINWTQGIFAVGLSGTYKSGYLDQDPGANNQNRVNRDFVANLFGSVAPTKNVSMTLGVRNLFDRAPAYSNQNDVFQANYDPRFSDPTGRTYYARMTYQF